MAFTNPDFPNQIFKTFDEYEEARKKRANVEKSIAERAQAEEITKVTATVIPASKELVERKMVDLEKRIRELEHKASGSHPTHNREGIQIGTVLRGESKGQEYTLEVLDEKYLCSDGVIYDTLSGAALGVSGNRRSGWKFWRDVAGTPIGEITGRFQKNAASNPFDS